MPPVPFEEMVLVGTIARPHGIRGQVVINPETDFVEERYAPGATLWTRERPLTIASMRLQRGRPVVGFEGCSRIEDVERLAGLELRVPESALRPLQAGSYYRHQLIGCVVETLAGTRVGTVRRVEGGAAGSLLTIAAEHGEVLVPMAAGICVEIDVEAKRIVIDPPEGLLELNQRAG